VWEVSPQLCLSRQTHGPSCRRSRGHVAADRRPVSTARNSFSAQPAGRLNPARVPELFKPEVVTIFPKNKCSHMHPTKMTTCHAKLVKTNDFDRSNTGLLFRATQLSTPLPTSDACVRTYGRVGWCGTGCGAGVYSRSLENRLCDKRAYFTVYL